MNFEELKKYEPIYVIGHMNIDLDSAVSSKILCEILNKFNIKSYYAVLDSKYDFDLTNKKMLDDCMNFNPVIINRKDVKKYNWFLVDHNDKLQSVGMDANVVGCIDHHPNSNQVKNAIISDICSSALFIYNYFKDKYSFNDEQKYQIFLAFLGDAGFGKSSKYKESDEVIAKSLGFNYDYNELFKKYFTETDLSKGVKNSIYNGYKEYKFENVTFGSGRIEVFGINGLEEYKDLISKMDSFLGIWKDYENNNTYVYFKYDGKFKEYFYNYNASRTSTILPNVLKYLKEEGYIYGERKRKLC